MSNDFNSSIGTELASLRALGAVRRRLSARDRLIRERQEAVGTSHALLDAAPAEDCGAND